MSVKHPIISVTGSSGAGTTSVRKTFEIIFRREGIEAVYVEGDLFHRYDRAGMRAEMAAQAERGNKHFSHFSPESNLFDRLEALFAEFGATGRGWRATIFTTTRKRSFTEESPARSRRGSRCRLPISCSTKACTARSSPTASTSQGTPISRSALFPSSTSNGSRSCIGTATRAAIRPKRSPTRSFAGCRTM